MLLEGRQEGEVLPDFLLYLLFTRANGDKFF